MNENNLAYLRDNLKYLGFGTELDEALQNNMAAGKKDFTLQVESQRLGSTFSATLHFRKSEVADIYFFNKWEASLKNEVGTMHHNFYLNKGHGVTFKEGFNLLEGRSVYKELNDKEGQKYHAWLQLDRNQIEASGLYKMQQYHQNYGYDLEKTVSIFPIKELEDPAQKEALLKSLQKGNVQSVTFEKNGFAEKLFIEAAPQFKSINAYDHNGQRISMNDLVNRFEFSVNTSRDEVTMLGSARQKINGKDAGELGGRVVEKAQEPKEHLGSKENVKTSGLLEQKPRAGHKGQHL